MRIYKKKKKKRKKKEANTINLATTHNLLEIILVSIKLCVLITVEISVFFFFLIYALLSD
jgi:hypothetical protein